MAAQREFDLQGFIDNQKLGPFQWLILILCLGVLIVDGIDTLAVAFIAPAAMKEFGVGGRAFSPVMMSSLAGVALGSFLAGPISDRFGRKVITVAALLVTAMFCFASAAADGITSLSILRFLTGLGLGASIPNALVTMAEYAPARHRSLMVTTVFCGISLGAGVAGSLYALVEPRFGWRAMLVVGGILPIVLIPLLLVYLPESVRFLLVADANNPRVARILKRMRASVDAATPVFARAVHEGPVRSPLAVVVSAIYLRRTLTLWIAYFSVMYMTYVIASWLPTLARRSGFSLSEAALLSTAWGVGGVVGALAVGWQMDRWHPRKVLLGTLAFALLVCAVAYLSAVGTIFVAILFLLGYCVLGVITGLGAVAAAAYETAARVTGTSSMLGIGRIGGVVGIMLGASMIEANWTLEMVLGALGAAVVLGLVGTVFLPDLDGWRSRPANGNLETKVAKLQELAH